MRCSPTYIVVHYYIVVLLGLYFILTSCYFINVLDFFSFIVFYLYMTLLEHLDLCTSLFVYRLFEFKYRHITCYITLIDLHIKFNPNIT